MTSPRVQSSRTSRTQWGSGTLAMVLLSLVVATGCRSCGSKNKHKAKAKAKVVQKRPPSKPITDMVANAGPKGKLKKLAMKEPGAEEAREVAPEVAAARDLIVKADKASTEAGRTQLTEFLNCLLYTSPSPRD